MTGFVCAQCQALGAGSGFCGQCGARNWMSGPATTAASLPGPSSGMASVSVASLPVSSWACSGCGRAGEGAGFCGQCGAHSWVPESSSVAVRARSRQPQAQPERQDATVAELAVAEQVLAEETPAHAPSQATAQKSPGSRVVSRATLPNSLQQIREFGDYGNPYWCPAYDDDGKLVLEPGEKLLWTRPSRVDGHGTRAPLPGAVAVTNKRVVWACTGFDKGGGWVGFGVVGLTVATTANVMSKRAAKKRSEAKVLAGQVRYEWLVSVAEQSISPAYASQPERRVVLACAGQPIGTAAILYDQAGGEGMAEWIAQVALAHRTGYADVLSAPDAAALEAVAPSLLGKMAGPRGGDWTMWRIPGDQGLLISAAYEDLVASASR